MTTEHRPRPPTSHPRTNPGSELKRIPLPPLPSFRKPAGGVRTSPTSTPAAGDAATGSPAHSVSHVEMSELLGPRHEGGIAPLLEPVAPQRTGATGATVLNDLVDEIEKGLVKELARAPLKVTTPGYRHTVACNIGPGPDPSGTLECSRPAAPPAEGPERRSGE